MAEFLNPHESPARQGTGATDSSGLLPNLLKKPFVPTDPEQISNDADATDWADVERQANASADEIARVVLERSAKAVAGSTRGGKIKVIQSWYSCHMTAFVVERRGRGLLVQADDVQAWLPAEKVYVLNPSTISVPEWLLRQRGDEFMVYDCREGRRPTISWNSSGGDYHGSDS